MTSSNHLYNKLDKKIFVSMIAVTVLYFVVCVVSCINIAANLNFYRNAKHIGGVVKNIKNDGNSNRVIRVAYIVDKKSYINDINYNVGELGEIEIGDTIDIFYNKKDPNEANITTKTVGSVYLTMFILVAVFVLLVIYIIKYYMRIKLNIRLIEEDNYVMAKFSRIEFKNSYNPFMIGRVNRVYCKAKINDDKKIFKSVAFAEKTKPLNDTSMIKVYIDKNDTNKYLVDLNDIIDYKNLQL